MHPIGGWTYIAFSAPPSVILGAMENNHPTYPGAMAYLTTNYSVQLETTDPFRGHTSNNAHILHVAESEEALDSVRCVSQFTPNNLHITTVVNDIGSFFKAVPNQITGVAKWAGDIGRELQPYMQLAATGAAIAGVAQ